MIEQKHTLKGASAVIEKDAIASKLACDIHADELIILTGVDCVYTSFGKDDAKPVPALTVEEAGQYIEAGEFEAGTMLPKIEACVSFLEKNPGSRALITSIAAVPEALRGKAGTVMTV